MVWKFILFRYKKKNTLKIKDLTILRNNIIKKYEIERFKTKK